MKKLALIFVSLFLLAGLVTAAAPVIDSINDQTITAGDDYSYQVVASDADNDTLTYTFTQSPAGMTISSSGLIEWTPVLSSSQTVIVQVSDGTDTDTESFVLTVQNDLPALTLSQDSLSFGDDDADRGETYTQTLTVTNTGTQDLTNLQGELKTNTGKVLPDDFNGVVQFAATSLAVGQSTTVLVSLDIPLNQDSREQTIGKLHVTANGDSISTTETASLTMEAKSYLRIKKVEIDVEGDEETISDGENYDKIKEGDEVTVTVTIENIYDDNDKDIENVYFQIDADDSDWDIDEEESDEDDIRGDDDQKFDVTFTIGDDIDGDDTDVIIEVFGDDNDDDFEHYDSLTFSFEIDRERDEVSITRAELDRTSYTCDTSYADLEVRIKNTGTDDQDEVTLQLVADELGWHDRELDIELDEGDSDTFEFRIPLNRADETDDYFVEIETFYNDDEESDSETVVITVICDESSSSSSSSSSGSTSSGSSSSGSTSTNDDEEDTVVIITPPTSTTGNTGASTGSSGTVVYGEPVGVLDDVRGSDLYVVLLIALLVLVIIGIILLGGRLLKNN